MWMYWLQRNILILLGWQLSLTEKIGNKMIWCMMGQNLEYKENRLLMQHFVQLFLHFVYKPKLFFMEYISPTRKNNCLLFRKRFANRTNLSGRAQYLFMHVDNIWHLNFLFGSLDSYRGWMVKLYSKGMNILFDFNYQATCDDCKSNFTVERWKMELSSLMAAVWKQGGWNIMYRSN